MITLFCARSAAIHNSVHYSFIVSPALPLCSCRQQKQGRDVCDVSPLLSVLLTGNKPLDFCIYTCVAVVIDSLKLLSKNPSFFQKYTWTANLDRRSFSHVLLLHFISLLLVILKNFGHTGIANTKKWLDQAVFPCWSNYHTLAGE